MRRFIQAFRSRLNGEVGAVSVLFAILFSTGFILILVALVVDSGQVYLQRIKLQNAASLVATALAKNCSAKDATCTSTLSSSSTLQQIANSASPNNPNYITKICGSSAAVTSNPSLTLCGALDTTNPKECKVVDTTTNTQYAKYVRVHLSSISNAGENSAFFPFFQSILDPGADSSERFTACAQYAYGKASAILTDASILPLPVVKVALTMCDILAVSPLQSKNPETGSTNCSFTDNDNVTWGSTLHGHFVYKFGGSPCSAGATIAVGDTLCIDDWGNAGVAQTTRTGLINQISTAVKQQKKYQLPVLTSINKTGSQWTGQVASFVNVTFKSFRWAAQTLPSSNYQCITYPGNVVQTGATFCGTSAWAFCDGNTKYCFTAQIQKGIATLPGSGKKFTGPNFGLESLTPLP